MAATIPVEELARRLCVAGHRFIHQTGAIVPCGEHLTIARNSYGLLTNDSGWAVFEQARLAMHERAGASEDEAVEALRDHLQFESEIGTGGTPPTDYEPTLLTPIVNGGAGATPLAGLLEQAWGLIANAGNGQGMWAREGVEWAAAAAQWRNDYFATLAQEQGATIVLTPTIPGPRVGSPADYSGAIPETGS